MHDSLPEPLLSALDTVRFVDKPAALKRLAGLRQSVPDTELLDQALRRLILTLSEVAAADACLVSFERFWHRSEAPLLLARFFVSQPRAIEMLVKLFVGSQYLTETLLKHPEYLERLTQHRQLAEMKSREDFINEARQSWPPAATLTEQLDALRQYQRWEILRIGACDAFALLDLRSATNQLSLLADAMVGVCLELVSAGCQQPPDIICVVGMGKLGGEELNYSSDIDLIFLTESPGAEAVAVGQRLVKALQDQTQEGFLYRVDLRLRPWGRSGELVSTVAGYLDYLGTHAELWERQALLKARVIAGKRRLGQELLRHSQGIIFSASAASVRSSIRTAKQRIEADLHRRGRGWGEVKAGAGSIRDVEFVVQCLQLSHGGKLPHIRTPNTLDGLIRLADTGLLAADEYRQLSGGYLFLRTIEHALQLAHNKQLHTLPADPRELQSLARRLDFSDADSFVLHYEQHCRAIRTIYSRRLESDPHAESIPADLLPLGSLVGNFPAPSGAHDLIRVGNTYLTTFSLPEQAEHARWLQLVTERQPVKVLATSLPENLWRVTVLGIDGPGDLSIICGLLFVYGFNIRDGIVSTGQHSLSASLYKEPRWAGAVGQRTLRDFVDVFTVQGPYDGMISEVWQSYEADLLELLLLLRHGKAGEAQGRLAKRVARALEGSAEDPHHLLPVKIDLDNSISERGTALQIQAEDTLGFLYELTNALALSGIDIEEVIIRSNGNRVFDTLVVTDAQQGGKILDRQRLEELRAAVILIKQFTHLLPRSPNPEAALFHFRAFVQELFRRPDWMEELSSLERPDVLDALAQLLGVSDFLWEDFLRLQHSNLFPILRDLSALQKAHSRQLLVTQLQDLIANRPHPAEWRKTLNEFKDREMFRVDMRHILGQIDRFEQFSVELTSVAEVVVEAAANRGYQQLVERFGVPTGQQQQPCRWCLCALGKFGGLELGFASDIELMFLFEIDGHTTGHSLGLAQTPGIANAEFFQRWVELFTQSIEARNEGVFHLDLRLRPYGRSGPLAVPLEAFWKYFCTEGPAWPFERQALVKLRPIAGDIELGQQVLSLRDQAVYTGRPFDFSAMRALRERQLHQLVRAGTVNAKLSPGGLVDVEYLVQGLQISHGLEFPALRTTNTLQAIEELAKAKVLTTDEAGALSAAYRFWRRLIDALRMVRGNARDLTVPAAGTEEFEFLGRRLGGTPSETPWEQEIERQSQVVIDLSRRYEPERPGA